MARLLRRLLGLGALAALGIALFRFVQARRSAAESEPGGEGPGWEPAPFPFPPVPRPARATAGPGGDGDGGHPAHHLVLPEGVGAGGGPETEATASEAPWMEPLDGTCPSSHPVKAKLSSGIFHVPGGRNYERTNADRCYCDADAAEADGLRASKV